MKSTPRFPSPFRPIKHPAEIPTLCSLRVWVCGDFAETQQPGLFPVKALFDLPNEPGDKREGEISSLLAFDL